METEGLSARRTSSVRNRGRPPRAPRPGARLAAAGAIPVLVLWTPAAAYAHGDESGVPARDSVLQGIVSGVATHGVALFIGYTLCLAWLGWRLHREGEADMVTELGRELGQPAR